MNFFDINNSRFANVTLRRKSISNDVDDDSQLPVEPTQSEMAKNTAESRIPIPRAVRPSFLPKLRANKLTSGHRRSAIISGYPQVSNYETDITTPKVKNIKRAASTPATQGKPDGTYNTARAWSADNNDDERSECLSNEKLDFLGLVEDPQLKRLDEGEDNNCHLEVNNLVPFGDVGTTASAPPHYLMLHKQNSFEHDESLGILTPDQMPDFTVALEGSRTPSCENLTGSGGAGKLMRHSASRPSEVPLSIDVEPIANSIERSPSPEELPLDPKPAEPVRSVLPVSFITSITSITSLEAGYQGDGENSRPASRGPELPLVVAPSNLIVAPCRQDPMTDSDFFTESDADAHEEIIRGDRRAQVIDGTLFCAPGGRICPSFMGEEMDSSGIYSDLDKRQDDRPNGEEIFSEDRTPDTADTELSQKSQLSPNIKPEPAQIILNYLQDTSKNVLEVSNDSMESSMPMEVTTIEVDRNRNRQIETDDDQQSKPNNNINNINNNNKNDNPPHVKKYKMPKRNVISKIKEMIESGQKDESKESRRPQRTPRKNGRWDAVMNKIEAGKNEARARVMRKDVKSRVLQNLTNATTSSGRRNCGDANNNAGSNKDKRRGRGRQETKSPNQETARSSVRSSTSDLSSAPGKDVPKRSPPTNNQTRRQVNGRSNQVSRTNSYEAKKTCLDPPTVNLEKSPSATRKAPIVRRAATIIPNKQKSSSSIKDRGPKETTTSPGTREKTAQTDAVINENFNIKRAESTIQALSITVNYLANELDGFSSLRWRRNYEMMKTKWLTANENVENLRSRHIAIEQSIEENKEEHRRALERLQENLDVQHAEHIKGLEQAMREERALFERRLQETAKENRATIARLQAEHETELTRVKEDETDNRRIFVHDQGAVLQAEADSLRTVLDLRSKEITGLRSEIDFLRRELEGKQMLEQRVESLEAKCEDLKAQLQSKEIYERQISHENEVLLDSYHEASKHNKRLTQRNEELLWRLRQKNEVVNVLATQLATPPQRLSRSLGPEHIDHTITGSNSPQSSSMVKYIVEKGDSISWTVTMDEAAERVAPSRRNTVSRQSSLRLALPRGQTTSSVRARSKSVSVSEPNETNTWTPAFNSTPLRRRPGSVSPSTNSESVEETSTGPRPQEAGGEAMISEETSTSSSEDESFANGDISRLTMDFWEKSSAE